MADYTVGISSSFVKKKFKIKGDSGKGESTIYMGPRSKKVEFDSYFDFSGPTTYKLDNSFNCMISSFKYFSYIISAGSILMRIS